MRGREKGSLSESGRPWGCPSQSPGTCGPGTQWALGKRCSSERQSGHVGAGWTLGMGITRSPRRAGTLHARLGAAGQGGRSGGVQGLQVGPGRLCWSLTTDATGPGDFLAVLQGRWPRTPPEGGDSLPVGGRSHLGQWLLHPRQGLGMNYFSTFTQEQTGMIRHFLTKGGQELINPGKFFFHK